MRTRNCDICEDLTHGPDPRRARRRRRPHHRGPVERPRRRAGHDTTRPVDRRLRGPRRPRAGRLRALDLCLPDANGVQTGERRKRQRPDLPIVVLTGSDDDKVARQALSRAPRTSSRGHPISAPTSPVERSATPSIERPRPVRSGRLALNSATSPTASPTTSSHRFRSSSAQSTSCIEARWERTRRTREFLEMVQRSTGRLLEMVDRLSVRQSQPERRPRPPPWRSNRIAWVRSTIGSS